ncbi:MAG: hypothetical protein HQL76_10400 [Magnetococcales bacterium]|nr:hypothetical protein [Magnetococcales bacterium]
MIQELSHGKLIAGAIPVGGLHLVPQDKFELLNFGLAARGPVRSVALFSRIAFDAFSSQSTVRITTESVSSVRLLSLLWKMRTHHPGIPTLATPEDTPDGELLIGNAALIRQRHGNDQFITDLSQRWFINTQLPFVFARWVMASTINPQQKNDIHSWLSEIDARREELLQQTAYEPNNLMPPQEILSYLKHISWKLGPEEEAGQHHFLNTWKQLGNEPVFQERSYKNI